MTDLFTSCHNCPHSLLIGKGSLRSRYRLRRVSCGPDPLQGCNVRNSDHERWSSSGLSITENT